MGNLLPLFSHFAANNCSQQFLGFQSWNAYFDTSFYMPGTCNIVNFPLLGAHSGILLILLAILDDLFRAVGLLAVAFLIWTGAKYILSQGSPDETSKALSTGINALVGIGISLVAVWFVSFLGNQLDSSNQNAGKIGLLDLSALPNPASATSGSFIQTALSIAFGVVGVIAFLIIIIAGMNYVFSQGDAQATAKAKNAIIYALVGLVVAILAQSIVSFAVSSSR